MMDTRLKVGSDFEARVASLLRSSPGYRNVREQQHVRGKNVDIIFQKQWNPHREITIAVECKDWRSGLDRPNAQEIYLDYKPLLDAGDVDEVWIVTPHPVAATVQEYVDAFHGLEILHINEFEQDIIDFSLYTTYLVNRFSQDKLSQYYIPSRLENSQRTLHDEVVKWLQSESSDPIAIWAGYGMGKTSYAMFLASTLASEFASDRTKRIPILIPLGDFYTAPRIDGLFANVLTNEFGVHGYNFNTFWNLHEAGRFVIILDGFDEMKHAMTKVEFAAIAKEIRKLIIPRSKIILLGRPDAIVSDEEHSVLVQGTRSVSGLKIPDGIDASFKELRLDFFSKDEYLLFLRRYISAFYDQPDLESFLDKRIAEVQKIDLSDILKRPVQARMLAQILLNPTNSIEKISKFELYNMFIDECLSREAEKHERQKTDTRIRRRFMQDLAWWLWAVKRTRTFTITEIPIELTKSFMDSHQDALGQIRELLIGSVVEERSIGSLVNEKSAGNFYFPHLSFTEFLVAEYVIERKLTNHDVSILARSFEGEISSFLQTYSAADAIYKLYLDIAGFKASLPWGFIRFLTESPTLKHQIKKLAKREVTSVWQFAVEFVAMMENGEATDAIAKCANVISCDQFLFASIATQLMIRQLLTLQPKSTEFKDVARSLLSAIFREIHVDTLEFTTRKGAIYEPKRETEEYCAGLLKHIGMSAQRASFFFESDELYASALNETGERVRVLDDAAHEAPSRLVEVKFLEIRKRLRNRHDQEQYDLWIRKKTKVSETHVFDLVGRRKVKPIQPLHGVGF